MFGHIAITGLGPGGHPVMQRIAMHMSAKGLGIEPSRDAEQ